MRCFCVERTYLARSCLLPALYNTNNCQSAIQRSRMDKNGRSKNSAWVPLGLSAPLTTPRALPIVSKCDQCPPDRNTSNQATITNVKNKT